MITVLVTGGAGFIGSHLCDYLIRTGHRVICVDNLSSCTKENNKHMLKNENFKFQEDAYQYYQNKLSLGPLAY